MDELDLDFQLEPYSLESMSTTVVCCQMWEGLDLTLETRNFLDNLSPSWRKVPPKVSCLNDLTIEMSNFISRILNQMDHPALPKVYQTKIKAKLLEMVEQTFNWTLFLKHDLFFCPEITEKIYWTSNGLIDEDRIFNNFWTNNFADMKLPLFLPSVWVKSKVSDKRLNVLQLLSCIFAQTDFIKKTESDFFYNIPNSPNNVYKIMNLVIDSYSTTRKELILFPQILKISSPTKSNLEMLHISKRLCFHRAFIYFWNNSDEFEKHRYLEEQIRNGSILVNEKIKYGDENLFQIALFLIREMDDTQKHDFFLHNLPKMISMFLKKESFIIFCIPLLNEFLPLLEESEMKDVLITFLQSFKEENHLEEKFKILDFLVENLPLEVKIDAFFSMVGRKEIGASNLKALKLILNENDLKDGRLDFLGLPKD